MKISNKEKVGGSQSAYAVMTLNGMDQTLGEDILKEIMREKSYLLTSHLFSIATFLNYNGVFIANVQKCCYVHLQ